MDSDAVGACAKNIGLDLNISGARELGHN